MTITPKPMSPLGAAVFDMMNQITKDYVRLYGTSPCQLHQPIMKRPTVIDPIKRISEKNDG